MLSTGKNSRWARRGRSSVRRWAVVAAPGGYLSTGCSWRWASCLGAADVKEDPAGELAVRIGHSLAAAVAFQVSSPPGSRTSPKLTCWYPYCCGGGVD
jgi:hypothetical protein